MELDIRAGKRVLYKHNGQWEVGRLAHMHANLIEEGLYIFIIPKEFLNEVDEKNIPYVHDAEINDIFLDAQPVEEYWKQYKDIFMSKNEYINFIENEDFDRRTESAWVSDGEYYYYPISKYTRSWLEKQPFEYVVRSLT